MGDIYRSSHTRSGCRRSTAGRKCDRASRAQPCRQCSEGPWRTRTTQRNSGDKPRYTAPRPRSRPGGRQRPTFRGAGGGGQHRGRTFLTAFHRLSPGPNRTLIRLRHITQYAGLGQRPGPVYPAATQPSELAPVNSIHDIHVPASRGVIKRCRNETTKSKKPRCGIRLLVVGLRNLGVGEGGHWKTPAGIRTFGAGFGDYFPRGTQMGVGYWMRVLNRRAVNGGTATSTVVLRLFLYVSPVRRYQSHVDCHILARLFYVCSYMFHLSGNNRRDSHSTGS